MISKYYIYLVQFEDNQITIMKEKEQEGKTKL